MAAGSCGKQLSSMFKVLLRFKQIDQDAQPPRQTLHRRGQAAPGVPRYHGAVTRVGKFGYAAVG